MYTRINSIEELKANALNESAEFFILISGILRSSKMISYYSDSNTFDILNEIDWTSQENLSEEELRSKTLIAEAIENKCFFKYNFGS